MISAKNIIFDYGGVISLGSRKKEIIQSLSNGKLSIENELKVFFSSNFIYDAAKGKYNQKEIFESINSIINKRSISKLDEIFKKSCEPSSEMLILLNQLTVNYNLYLISDSIPPFTNYIKENIAHLFSELFFSDLLKSRKSENLFDIVEDDYINIFNGNIYIDDKIENLVVPKSKGAKTILFKSVCQLKEKLSELKILL